MSNEVTEMDQTAVTPLQRYESLSQHASGAQNSTFAILSLTYEL